MCYLPNLGALQWWEILALFALGKLDYFLAAWRMRVIDKIIMKGVLPTTNFLVLGTRPVRPMRGNSAMFWIDSKMCLVRVVAARGLSWLM